MPHFRPPLLPLLFTLLFLGSCSWPPGHQKEEIPPVVQIMRKVEAQRRALPTRPSPTSPALASATTPRQLVEPPLPEGALATPPSVPRPIIEPPLPLPGPKPDEPASDPTLVNGEVVLKAEPAKISQEEANNLLEEAQYSFEAQQVLADLWKQRRLSDATTLAIVDAFLTLKLVEEPLAKTTAPNTPAQRKLKIVPHTDFPFPATATVAFASDISVQRDACLIESESKWNGPTPLNELEGRFVGTHTETYPGTPTAVALCKIRLMDTTIMPAKIVWTMTKALQPLTLQPRG
jgi:hypothetical protein